MRRDPSPTAYDASAYDIHSTGRSSSKNTPAGDSTSGRVNLPEQHTNVMPQHMADVPGPARGLRQGR